MGFFKQVAAALTPPSIARRRDAAPHPPDEDGTASGLEAMTPEERVAYEANRAAVAESRAAAEAERNRAREREDAARAEGEAISVAERAARDAARAPYRAVEPSPVAISRVATRGGTPLAELLDHLRDSGLAARPDLVFGVYRVPERGDGPSVPDGDRSRIVAWDVVHVPVGDEPSSAERPVATSFVGAEQWLARRSGEPTEIDEELAVAFCAEAGIGPERCLGLARISEVRGPDVEAGDPTAASPTVVRGVVAIHPPESSGAFARMRAAAPLELPHELPGVHHETLDWAAVARAVHAELDGPPPVPSPAPHLPATPQELLCAYLEVVGLSATDCYGVQAIVDEPLARPADGSPDPERAGDECADRPAPERSPGGERVVISYRDRAVYAEGRERWSAYQHDVLAADLRRGDDS